MDFAKQKKDPKCLLSAAHGWLGFMNFVFGEVSIDNTRYAKIGLQGSLREIDSSEEELKMELDAVLGRIRAMQSKQKGVDRVKSLLVQHKKIRGRIETLQRKRDVLQNHMETLENSELNQQVLYSMQRTSHALKAMGLDKTLQSVDKVMLDLEENHNDMNSLQHSLGTGYVDEEETDWASELNKIMNEECFVETPEVCNSTRPKTEDARAKVATKVEDVEEVYSTPPEAAGVAGDEKQGDEKQDDEKKGDEKKAEHAVIV
jgi:hypothetical protein